MPCHDMTRFTYGRCLQSLDLTANRLRQLEAKLLALTGLQRLCLRQNLVTSSAKVEQLASAPGKWSEGYVVAVLDASLGQMFV